MCWKIHGTLGRGELEPASQIWPPPQKQRGLFHSFTSDSQVFLVLILTIKRIPNNSDFTLSKRLFCCPLPLFNSMCQFSSLVSVPFTRQDSSLMATPGLHISSPHHRNGNTSLETKFIIPGKGSDWPSLSQVPIPV